MATDGLVLLQFIPESATPLGVLGIFITMLGYVVVGAVKSIRSGWQPDNARTCIREHGTLIRQAASDSKDAKDILIVEDGNQRKLVYHERGLRDAIDTMHRDVVNEIRSLRTVLESNKGE
jgi:hypothetical protein